MHEGPLGVHEVELVVETRPGLPDGGGVGQHAHCTGHLRQVASRHHGRRLVVDTNLQEEKEESEELFKEGKLLVWLSLKSSLERFNVNNWLVRSNVSSRYRERRLVVDTDLQQEQGG